METIKLSLSKSSPALVILALLVLPRSQALGQAVVDAGGPRNSFYGDDAGKTFGLQGLHVKLDTSSETIEGDYFHAFDDYKWLYGISLKLTAQNGIDSINSWPQTDLSAICNYSGVLDYGASNKFRGFWSLTLRDTPEFAQDPLYNSKRTVDEYYKVNALGNSLPLTFSIVPGGCIPWLSFAFSGGYSFTNNYASLEKVTVGKSMTSSGSEGVVGTGQTARFGAFEDYNAFPLSVMTPISFDAMNADWATNFSKWFGKTAGYILNVGSSKNPSSYVLIVSPYVSYIPADLGRPGDFVGLNIVVRGLAADSTGQHPEKESLSLPVSIFIERDNAFIGKPSMSVGAALIFKWPNS
jgi:hypothetical protein